LQADTYDRLRVIVTTDNDTHYKQDLSSLRNLNISVAHRFSSAYAALDCMRYNPIHLLLTDKQLSDMEVHSFVKEVNSQFRDHPVPVVIVSEDSRRDFVLDCIGAGCSAFIIRPYSLDTLKKQLATVFSLDKFKEIENELLDGARDKIANGDYDNAIDDLNELLNSEKNEADYYFDLGTQYLLQKKYAKAIVAFKKVLKMNNMFIKAYTGMAEAHKGKGDMEQYKYYLQKAADEYARMDEFEKVRELFVAILKTDPHAPNPYNTLGINLRKKGEYQLAKDAYIRALKLNPEDENIHYNLAKALYFDQEYDSCLDHLTQALTVNPQFQEARGLYQKLTGKSWQAE
jgi:tetratricopeptide (TPR) repeat protein